MNAEQVSLSAMIDYTIKRAGVFTLKVALPDGYRIERVSGNNILQYAERTDAGTPVSDPARQNSNPQRAGLETGAPQRILEVTLKERTSGTYAWASN